MYECYDLHLTEVNMIVCLYARINMIRVALLKIIPVFERLQLYVLFRKTGQADQTCDADCSGLKGRGTTTLVLSVFNLFFN